MWIYWDMLNITLYITFPVCIFMFIETLEHESVRVLHEYNIF